MLFFAALDATAQQADPLPQLQLQLQQLKQQYADTTHDFEQRIAALEQQLDKANQGNREDKERGDGLGSGTGGRRSCQEGRRQCLGKVSRPPAFGTDV
jgi:hypothetical protein